MFSVGYDIKVKIVEDLNVTIGGDKNVGRDTE